MVKRVRGKISEGIFGKYSKNDFLVYVHVEESFDTIFNMGYGGGVQWVMRSIKSPM